MQREPGLFRVGGGLYGGCYGGTCTVGFLRWMLRWKYSMMDDDATVATVTTTTTTICTLFLLLLLFLLSFPPSSSCSSRPPPSPPNRNLPNLPPTSDRRFHRIHHPPLHISIVSRISSFIHLLLSKSQRAPRPARPVVVLPDIPSAGGRPTLTLTLTPTLHSARFRTRIQPRPV